MFIVFCFWEGFFRKFMEIWKEFDFFFFILVLVVVFCKENVNVLND